MARVAGHSRAKYEKVCRLCGEKFFAKHPRTQVCYEDKCQREAKAETDRRKYLRQKGQEVSA